MVQNGPYQNSPRQISLKYFNQNGTIWKKNVHTTKPYELHCFTWWLYIYNMEYILALLI